MSLLDRLFFFIANVGWLFVRTALALVWGGSKIILIPDLPPPYTISLGNLAIPKRYNGKVRLIGPIVDHDHLNLHSGSQAKRKLGFRGTRSLIYAAVSGPRVEREVLANILLHSFRGLSKQYDVVLSRGDPNGKMKPRRVRGVVVYDWIENQDDFIRASDVVVGRAGHGTIMKSLAYGKPMILVPIPDHTEQYGNARRAISLQVAEMIEQNKLNHQTLESKVREILGNRRYRAHALEIMKEVSPMHSISVACEAISSLVASS